MKSYQEYVGIKRTKVSDEFESNLECLNRLGYFILPRVFSSKELIQLRQKIDHVWDVQLNKYGSELLSQIGDEGQIRAMMLEDKSFLDLIRHPKIFKYVAAVIGETAILHLQNGIVLFPSKKHNQARFHKDFPKDFLSSKLLSLNAFVLIDDFNEKTGGTWVVPGSHKFEEMPSEGFMKKNAVQVVEKAGSVLIFDSLLWHRSGENRSEGVRRGINHQYTRPFIKQQLNYPELLKGKIDRESKQAQLLGFWSVPPKSVDEFRASNPKLRTYRPGQG